MDEDIKWTNLTRQQIADLLREKGISVSVTVVDQLLLSHKFRKRALHKCGRNQVNIRPKASPNPSTPNSLCLFTNAYIHVLL